MCLSPESAWPDKANSPDCRKTYITKRVVRPTPINPQKAATCAWLFALLKGGAPRWQTFFARAYTPYRSPEKLGAAARRQPLAKTRKSGLSHFFDTLTGCASSTAGFCFYRYFFCMEKPRPLTSEIRLTMRKHSGSIWWISFSALGSSRLDSTESTSWVFCRR